jgi:hypothetical protein
MYYVDYRLSKVLSEERIEQARRAHRRKRRRPQPQAEVVERVSEKVSAPDETKAA